ncbi:MAG: hypothetical protein HZA14_06030 [Nitrospirae bacterium]|nr:hypothetical protein [Nitrospirota bacterium]
MSLKAISIGLAILTAGINTGYGEDLKKGIPAEEAEINTRLEPPAEFPYNTTKRLWEGELEGRKAAYFKYKTEDILVVIQDKLPEEFRRIEYFDRDGDGNLNLVRTMLFRKGAGWENSEITEENRYAIEFVNGKYKEYMSKIGEKLEHPADNK